MPLVRVTLRKGKSSEFIRAAGDAIHAALVSEANAPEGSRLQIFDEVEADRLIANPTYGGVERSDHLIVIEITLNPGRPIEVKKALYAGIVAGLGSALGVRPDDVVISLREVSKEDWSFGKGIATYA